MGGSAPPVLDYGASDARSLSVGWLVMTFGFAAWLTGVLPLMAMTVHIEIFDPGGENIACPLGIVFLSLILLPSLVILRISMALMRRIVGCQATRSWRAAVGAGVAFTILLAVVGAGCATETFLQVVGGGDAAFAAFIVAAILILIVFSRLLLRK